MDVFWKKGYEATSLQDLIGAMGLSKSSFYQAFGSKLDLFSVTLDHYTDRMAADMGAGLENSRSALAFLEKIFGDIVEHAPNDLGRKGCFLMNTATEFSQSNESIAALTKSGMKKFEAVFFKAIKRAQEGGEIPAERDAHALAHFLVCNMSGLKTMVKAGAKQPALRSVVKTLIASLR